MRYVSHSDRLSNYRADRTTLRLLVLLLVASILALIQIASMSSNDVVLLSAENQVSRSFVVTQENEGNPFTDAGGIFATYSEEMRESMTTMAQLPVIVQEAVVANRGSDPPSTAISQSVIMSVSLSSKELASIPQIGNILLPLASGEPAVLTFSDAFESPILIEPDATESTPLEEPDATESVVVPNGEYFNGNEEEVIRLLNEKRAELGLSQLTYDPNLAVSADIRAQEISVLFSHTRPDGSAWNTSGYGIGRGENLAYGQEDPMTVVFEWMASPTHQSNMLNDIWKIVAVSCYQVNGVTYWVQHFA